MAIEIKIVIPSYKRAERVKTLDIISGIVCVPESEIKMYQEHNPDAEIMGHPDTVKGLALKRQWIYEKFGNVFMIDDDIAQVQKLHTELDERSMCTPEEIYDMIQFAGNMAHMTGAYLFGFSKNPRPEYYNEFKPFEMTGYITGCAMGMLKDSGLYFIKETVAVEDYWISCLNAFHNRIIFKDTRFYFEQEKTFTNAGGLSDYRTTETEKEDTLFLRKKFGEVIQMKKYGFNAKRTHEFQRSMKIPF